MTEETPALSVTGTPRRRGGRRVGGPAQGLADHGGDRAEAGVAGGEAVTNVVPTSQRRSVKNSAERR